MALEIRHWRAFATAAETLHFGLAAERLGLTQPALSQLIKTLEDAFNVRLFDRSRRRVSLTEAGRTMLPEAQAVLSQSRRAERLGLVAGRSSSRTLAIGYVGSAALHPLFTRLIGRLTAIRPELILRLDQSAVTKQIAQVRDHNLDIGIIRSPMPALDPAIATLSLEREAMVLAIARNNIHAAGEGPCDLSDFSEEPFLQYRQQEGGGLYLLTQSACERAGFQPQISQTVPQIATMLALVGAGLGVALVPESASRLGMPGVVCRALRDPVVTDFNLIYRRADTAPALREALKAARSIHKASL
ncbi:LysR family transcriptional regulator [Rhizobium halophytocola]|uniref:DNA-binding transcriptional LysR family regulator n=1 Tax=Rhizobium halophytocola TaxID=735519 RepID=A0ABS4DUP9_9HYPH|nr:LysR family transcriptional regulator [Rhizobium halophytocola]MBP1849421.1 DNA-binding transcriptional LysR family regulator [Rhizobium halophytocola]